MGPSAKSTNPAILLVDDRPENLIALDAVLQPLGHTLVRAFSGEEALRHLLLQDFAVILLDVQMPGMNGFEVAQIIKTRERSRHTPIIFLTAISKEEAYVFQGYSAGAVDYIFKPFNPDILRSKVSVFVELYMKGEQLREQGELLRQSQLREQALLHQSRLVESEARYAHIVTSAIDPIITFGDDSRITVFNPAAERRFGIPEAEAVGRLIEEFVTVSGGADLLEKWPLPDHDEPETANARSHTVSGSGVCADGSSFPVEFTVSKLSVSGERLHTLIVRDVSDRKRAEELLKKQKESLENTAEELRALNEELSDRTAELERAMGSRSRFYASMSHELRTPINAILGYTSLLLDDIYGPLNDQQIASITRTKLAGSHLLELVNDILDLSKIEAGKLELQIEEVRFPDVVEDLFVTVAPFAEKHGVELTLDADFGPWIGITDPRRVRQIALNLFSNAIKFGSGKPVHVTCSPAEDGGLIMTVTDHGAGIAPDDLERIFEEFVQLDQTATDPGTGLGLPISRRLAELLGGSLTVSSTLGSGSTFRLELPLADAASSPFLIDGATVGSTRG